VARRDIVNDRSMIDFLSSKWNARDHVPPESSCCSDRHVRILGVLKATTRMRFCGTTRWCSRHPILTILLAEWQRLTVVKRGIPIPCV
jgi:hypothetical protein